MGEPRNGGAGSGRQSGGAGRRGGGARQQQAGGEETGRGCEDGPVADAQTATHAANRAPSECGGPRSREQAWNSDRQRPAEKLNTTSGGTTSAYRGAAAQQRTPRRPADKGGMSSRLLRHVVALPHSS